MELKDLFLTPIYLIIIYGIAYWLRSKVTNKITKKYFIPALTVKLIGAISLGLIYYFYYKGGDTINYFDQSKIIYDAFYEYPSIGIKLLTSNGEFDPETSAFSSQLYWYNAPTEFYIVKLAALLGIISYHTYTVIAIMFAFISFSGMWAMYLTFYKLYPRLHKYLAYAVFFLPSVFFWGSGLMKDSITIGALGWLFYGFHMALIERKKIFKAILFIIAASYILLSIKKYIFLSFLPPALFWIFRENSSRIKSPALRALAKPLFVIFGIGIGFIGLTNFTEEDEKYSLEKIGAQSKKNYEYLTSSFVSTGSAYDIGAFDGSLSSIITVAPQAIVVSLFRPFIWEVKNPVMALSALEAALFVFLTLRFIFKTGFFKTLKLISAKPILTFCMIFALIFAIAVGVNSGNFGTLVRYKIPLMPFYLSALFIMQAYTKPIRKKTPQLQFKTKVT